MSTPRRSFLGRLGALFALGAVPSALKAGTLPSGDVDAFGPDERWLAAIAQQEHRLFVETGTLVDAPSFRRTLNFLDVYNSDFNIADARLGVALGVHGGAIALALGDALWAKYGLGERLGVRNAAGSPATAHPYRSGSAATVEGLATRGVHLLACNRSLLRFSRELAGVADDPAAVHRELLAGVLPRFQVVPALIVAVSRAQMRGVPYIVID